MAGISAVWMGSRGNGAFYPVSGPGVLCGGCDRRKIETCFQDGTDDMLLICYFFFVFSRFHFFVFISFGTPNEMGM